MRPVVWSLAAHRDVARIHRYIAQFSPAAAQRIAQELHEATDLLLQHPYAGRGATAGRRELVCIPYVIVYRVRSAEIRILRVWHGAQDRPGSR